MKTEIGRSAINKRDILDCFLADVFFYVMLLPFTTGNVVTIISSQHDTATANR